jgi:D-alanine-D-alanine ligase
MATRQLNILLLFDLSKRVDPEDFPELLKTEAWKNDAQLVAALKRLGHQVKLFGLYNEIEPLVRELVENRPDMVFNLSEAAHNDRKFEPHVVALLELLGIQYTGASSDALMISKDKGLSKKILAYHRIPVPKFVICGRSKPPRSLRRFQYPAFVKPLKLEASEGISQVSLAWTEKEALERIRYIHEKLDSDAIIEEYIDGRELYVAILGNDRLTALPPRELFFKEVPEGEPKFATYRAKWNDDYRERWGIDTGPAGKIPEILEEKILETSKSAYRALGLRGYGRVDLRLKPSGEFYVIEVNPNPAIAKDDDFMLAAAKIGLDFDAVISRILNLA